MAETILVVGGGGREHALTEALTTSAHDPAVYACATNRNPGITTLADGFRVLEVTDTAAVVDYATAVGATLAVIGPEAPLEAGVVDALEDAGVYTFGPTQAAARIETDKAYQRALLDEGGVSGLPEYAVFDDPEAACAYIDQYDGELAIKPAGLTGGKGVRLTGEHVDEAAAKAYIQESAYGRFVLEEQLEGEEFSLQAFVANGEIRPLPTVQDHKRAYEGDKGPNTGGMGAYSDGTDRLPFLTEEEYHEALSIIEQTVTAMSTYTGVLYGQFMATAEGVRLIEYNARFGDPEAMNILPVLTTDLVDVLLAARAGRSLPSVETTGEATVCKYAVPEGYPTDPQAGARVDLDPETAAPAELYYASVDAREDGVYTTTSRTAAVVGCGETVADAETQAAAAVGRATTAGLRIRHDIGTQSLVDRRIEHMNRLRGDG